MVSPPTGTVSFLFTDIEGSTKLAQAHPAAWETARLRHDAVLRAAIDRHHGYTFKVIGDGFCAAFATAVDALDAVVDAQREFHSDVWGETQIRVRMGLHTGAAEEQEGDYSGYLTLSRAQRLMSAGHGGQTLVSQSTSILLREHLPTGIALRDMGEHRLKDLVEPERIFQLTVPGLPTTFPPLKTLDAIPNNLPLQLTSFVGREHEIAEVKQLLASARLVTLTAPGGVGKTRLSLQVGGELVDTYADGVWLVELAPLTEPSQVPLAIASTLGVRVEQAGGLLDVLTAYLHEKQLLLILDNCEHLIAECARTAESLLRSCPKLRMLASSREALGIGGEVSFRVPSLAAPDPQHLPALDGLSEFEAVRLLVERAAAVQPSFSLTSQNAPYVAQICLRLDGIPLAIELAAARVKVLSIEQIAARLDDRLRLLTGGSRTALPRQQTLRALIDWSYDLLSDAERVILCRLSVFAGGWTLAAAEAICAGEMIEGWSVLDHLSRLVDKSLVAVDEQSADDGLRYRLLETIRQYAHERLIESRESDRVRERHAGYFLGVAKSAEPQLHTAAQRAWQHRLAEDWDNLRVALTWATESNLDIAVRLAGTLGYFWRVNAQVSEGREFLERLLSRVPSGEPRFAAGRAMLLSIAAEYATTQMDVGSAEQFDHESVTAWRGLGDRQGLAYALRNRAQRQHYTGEPALAQSDIDESVALYRQTSDRPGLANALYYRALILKEAGDDEGARGSAAEGLRLAGDAGDISMTAFGNLLLAELAFGHAEYERAQPLLAQGLSLAREVGDKLQIAISLHGLAELSRLHEHDREAEALYVEALDLSLACGVPWLSMEILAALGYTAYRLGAYDRARDLFVRDLPLTQTHMRPLVTARCFVGLAGVALAASADPTAAQRAACLLGTADALAEAREAFSFPPNRNLYEHIRAQARSALAEPTFGASWAAGHDMLPARAIALALGDSPH